MSIQDNIKEKIHMDDKNNKFSSSIAKEYDQTVSDLITTKTTHCLTSSSKHPQKEQIPPPIQEKEISSSSSRKISTKSDKSECSSNLKNKLLS